MSDLKQEGAFAIAAHQIIREIDDNLIGELVDWDSIEELEDADEEDILLLGRAYEIIVEGVKNAIRSSFVNLDWKIPVKVIDN